MKFSLFGLLVATSLVVPFSDALAASADVIAKGLTPHRASYDIDLIATHSGSQIVGISGKMSYEWRKTCDAWVTNHQFALLYTYAEGEGMRVESDFTTYETLDGTNLHYASRRQRNGEVYQQLRGHAKVGKEGGLAKYNEPAALSYDLKQGTIFPMEHTIALLQHASEGDTIYNAVVFDGSDEDGPIEINSLIGRPAKAAKTAVKSDLLNAKAWNVRMAVFNDAQKEEESDYEMDMVFHENGLISGMTIEYDDFSVKQSLISLEELPTDPCVSAPKKTTP